MKVQQVDKQFKKPVFCVQQAFMRHLAHVAGVEVVTVWQVGSKKYLLSAKMKEKPQNWFVSTRREPQIPRTFTRIEVAVRLGQKLFKAKELQLIPLTD